MVELNTFKEMQEYEKKLGYRGPMPPMDNVISIKFSERNKLASLEGRKLCTTRREPKGKPGDVFEIEGEWFQISAVIKGILWDVIHNYYIEEGYDSPYALAVDWYKLHRGHLKPDQEVYTHWYGRV